MRESGQTRIFLSHIVNSLVACHQRLYENSEVERGKAYKFQSPKYITPGRTFYFSKVSFEEGVEFFEWQLCMTREEFEKKHETPSHKSEWAWIPPDKASVFHLPQNQKIEQKIESLFNKNCVLYFPPNRFEDPGWLNYKNLLARPEFSDLVRIIGISHRRIIQYSPLDQNRDWLLDVVFDSYVHEMPFVPFETQFGLGQPVHREMRYFEKFGIASAIYAAANDVIRLILRGDNSLRFGFGPRQNRDLSLLNGSQQLVPNIFQLSTGETALLNLFLSILRDFDLTGTTFESLDKVRGIVLIDEIDVHLHCELQSKVLPSLIKHFPLVQFIVTSHSPLFSAWSQT